jgi:protease YdgD
LRGRFGVIAVRQALGAASLAVHQAFFAARLAVRQALVVASIAVRQALAAVSLAGGQVLAAASLAGGLGAWAAFADDLGPRILTAEEAPVWRAVGPLNVAGNRSCTATLISDHEAITAAHCLFHPVTRHRAAARDIKFVIGQDRDTYVAVRGVVRTALLPGYVYTGHHADLNAVPSDVALLELDAPVPAALITPLQVADWPATGSRGALVDIVGYGSDRRFTASIRSDCTVADTIETMSLVDCVSVPGLSGAPVTLKEEGAAPLLVAVVSATVGPMDDPTGSLVVSVAARLAELRARLE